MQEKLRTLHKQKEDEINKQHMLMQHPPTGHYMKRIVPKDKKQGPQKTLFEYLPKQQRTIKKDLMTGKYVAYLPLQQILRGLDIYKIGMPIQVQGFNIHELPPVVRAECKEQNEYYFTKKHVPHYASNMSREPAVDSNECRESEGEHWLREDEEMMHLRIR